jgi:hypothetical protein
MSLCALPNHGQRQADAWIESPRSSYRHPLLPLEVATSACSNLYSETFAQLHAGSERDKRLGPGEGDLARRSRGQWS